MTKLVITRGLPGAGKTYVARDWVAADSTKRVRVNRDDLRRMMDEVKSTWARPGAEGIAIAVRNAAIVTALKMGKDVINDDTNLPSRTVRDLRRLAKLNGAEFEIIDLTDVSLELCLVRNSLRDWDTCVPEAWIREQHEKFIKGRGHPLPVADDPGDEPALPEPYEAKPNTPKAIIVDIDGTVALKGDRSPYDETRIHEDRPHWPVIEAVTSMWNDGYAVIFVSGRTAGCWQETETWLKKHFVTGIGYGGHQLYMRNVGDGRKDSVVKLEIFDKYIRHDFDVVAVFDDRDQVVKMWRSLGLTVFQVAEGNF